MPGTPINDCLLSLAVALSAATGLAIAPVSPAKRAIWIHDAIEEASTDVYSVLRIYGGSEPGHFAGMRRPTPSIEIDTRGGDGQQVLAQAYAIHEALLEAPDGTPWLGHLIEAKKFDVDGVTIIDDDATDKWSVWVQTMTAPGIVGVDEDSRHVATSNYDIEFETLSQAMA
jgi:hypothetical protein